MSTAGPNAEHRVVEQALCDGEFHKSLLDHLEAGVYMVDISRRIVYWNRGAEQISGYLAHDVVGHFSHGELLLHSDAADPAACGADCPLLTMLLDGRPREYTILLRHHHGQQLRVHVRSRPIYESGGDVIGGGGVRAGDLTLVH
jgi:PAS domain S-box-containing protein